MSSILEAVAFILENYSKYSSCSEENVRLFFEQAKIPSISMYDYLAYLNTYTHCSEHCYVLSLIYVERLISNFRKYIFDNISLHKLFLIGLVVAAKYSEDKYYKNSYYAKVGGIQVSDFNNLEKKFLMLLDFDLYISNEQYEHFTDTIKSTVRAIRRQNYKIMENAHINNELASVS
ncbi:unnamed protein product [Blepharisma stoltei]|uniref:Cyclin n=1 Tax=Blepharisma stoltei TaxID=1481888 RepID=A0AAU9JL44_9CILI|nr:unnamed protein product [Blepharisma stoltei]